MAGHTRAGARGSRTKPINAAAGIPSAAIMRSRAPPARTMKRSVMTAKAVGRMASAIHTGSQPPIRLGASSSLCTKRNAAQHSPAATAVEASDASPAAAG